jgi:hypothetical protein
MMLNEGFHFHVPYANFSIWFDEDRIKRVIELVKQNRFDETYAVVWEEEVLYWEERQKEDILRVVGDIEILGYLARCWDNYNPYHIKDFLHDEILYHSEFLDNDIAGKDAFFRYFIGKLIECQQKNNRQEIFTAKIGYLKHKKFISDFIFGNCKPCVVVRQRSKKSDTVSIIEIETTDGKITKINVSDKPKEDGWNGLVENPFYLKNH